MSPRTQAWIGGGLLVLLVVLALFLGGSASTAGLPGSVGNPHDTGRRALALFLEHFAFAPQAWKRAPALLPDGSTIVWRADPSEPEDAREIEMARAARRATGEEPPSVGMHSNEHYEEFVTRGGTLVVEGASGVAFLRDDLGIPAAAALELVELGGSGVRRVRLFTGEILDVAAPDAFVPLPPGTDARELAVVEDEADGSVLAVEIPHGAGRVLAVAAGAPFDNVAIGEHDHALLAVRVAEAAPPGARVLFDEYALGLREHDGAVDVALRPATFLVTLHLVLAALVAAWIRAHPRAFPRDPEALETFSPLLRARAQARILERSGHAGRLAKPLAAAALERVARLAHVPAPRVARDGSGVPRDEVERLSRALPAPLGARLRALCAERRVATLRDLEAFAADLARLEADVARDGVRPGDPGR